MVTASSCRFPSHDFAGHEIASADVDNDSTADVTYQWDALGRRVGRDDGTTANVYVQNGQQTVADYTSGTAAASPTYTYVYARYTDEPVVRDGSGGLPYYHRNQQYSVTALTDSSGTVVERYAYDAYGNLLVFDGSGTARTATAEGNRYTYTGREWDGELSLYHYRARMYDAICGRFLSRDPIGYGDGPNTYALKQFLHHVDPYGRQSVSTGLPPFNLPLTPIDNGVPYHPDIIDFSDKAKAACKKVRDWRNRPRRGPRPPLAPKKPVQPFGFNQIKCAKEAKDFMNQSQDPRLKKLLAILDKKVGKCRVPPIICRCCPGGLGGAYTPHDSRNRITICTDSGANLPPNLLELLVHELTHSAQHGRSKNQGRTCGGSVRREIEAYFCSGSCNSFESCLIRSTGSSCWSNCTDPNVFSSAKVAELKSWFEQNSQTFLCQ